MSKVENKGGKTKDRMIKSDCYTSPKTTKAQFCFNDQRNDMDQPIVLTEVFDVPIGNLKNFLEKDR